MSYGVLVDLTICVGCRACVAACKQENGMPMNHGDHAAIESERCDCFNQETEHVHRPSLSAENYTVVECHNVANNIDHPLWVYTKRQCMHCIDPACESACPVEAFHKTPEGPVVYKPERCMGCRYCLMACPFSIPTYEWNKQIPYVQKCTFCVDRINADRSLPREERMPACVASCPSDCLKFGKREDLLAEAKRRIEKNPDRYHPAVYGESEAGGTAWLYLSAVPFDKLGFPDNVGEKPYSEYTETALGSVPSIIVAGGTVLSALYVMWKRRLDIAEERESKLSGEAGISNDVQ